MTNKALCIFHRGCMDGFSSAYVVGLFLGFDRVEFMQMDYGEPVPDITDRNVYIVDFSFRPDELLPVLDTATSVVMLDHHKSAIKHWDGIAADEGDSLINKKLLFVRDIKQSGVGITWNFFFSDKPMPSLLAVCQDYDLWLFKLPYTKQIVAALYGMFMIEKNDFARFGKLVDANDHTELVNTGNVLSQYQEDVARSIIGRCSKMVKVLDYVVPICPMPRNIHSVAGNILAIDHPFAITYEDHLGLGQRMFSLRSHKEYGIDVSKIAEVLGGGSKEDGGSGGGNYNAAGFVVDIEKATAEDPDTAYLFCNLDQPQYKAAVKGFVDFDVQHHR